mmetsp:Transcript_85522/g.250385  ORF Transcript_85522/g.250385 Transcript_85522/m.250385 type:complete len:228 (-) Transcript_85522:7-690(-)
MVVAHTRTFSNSAALWQSSTSCMVPHLPLAPFPHLVCSSAAASSCRHLSCILTSAITSLLWMLLRVLSSVSAGMGAGRKTAELPGSCRRSAAAAAEASSASSARCARRRVGCECSGLACKFSSSLGLGAKRGRSGPRLSSAASMPTPLSSSCGKGCSSACAETCRRFTASQRQARASSPAAHSHTRPMRRQCRTRPSVPPCGGRMKGLMGAGHEGANGDWVRDRKLT